MSAYVIVDMDLFDPGPYEDYKAKAPAIVARHGGSYLVRGGDISVEEGDWKPKRIVVLSFPDRAAAQAFFDDPDYAPLKAIRQRVATSRVIIVDGVA